MNTPQFEGHNDRIILFDGICPLCHRCVRLLLRMDRSGAFRFCSMQSRQGQALLLKHDLPTGRYDSFVYLESGSVYQRSEALLRIVGHLPRRWRWLELMRLCPRRWRDALYDWVARHRFRWFGRYASCPLPDPGWRERFLDR